MPKPFSQKNTGSIPGSVVKSEVSGQGALEDLGARFFGDADHEEIGQQLNGAPVSIFTYPKCDGTALGGVVAHG